VVSVTDPYSRYTELVGRYHAPIVSCLLAGHVGTNVIKLALDLWVRQPDTQSPCCTCIF
jgi:hypothetical protein